MIDTSGLGIFLEAPAIGFVEQGADKIAPIVTDIIGLLYLLDRISSSSSTVI